jgi:type VI protein secretion system component VasK
LVADRLASLVDEPIRQAGLLVSAVEPAQLNTWAREFCSSYNALVGSKFPFSSSSTAEPTLDDLLEVFKPGESRLWRLVSSLQPYVERQGNRYRSTGGGNLTINPDFLEFLSNAHRFSEAIFDQNRDRPRVSFFLRGQREQSDPAVEAILLNTDGGTISCTLTDCRTTDQIVWDGSAMVFSLSVRLEGESLPVVITPRAEGPWAPFRFFSGSTGLGDPQEVDHVVRWRIPGRSGEVAVAVTAGRSSWVFDPAILRGLQCVDRVAAGS